MLVYMTSTQIPTVETYDLYANNGRYIRKATIVDFGNGIEVRFVDRLPKGQAITQAEAFLARCPGGTR